ncbi:MAG: hypothetical protein ABI727_07320, partial [Nitrosospira sp.]
VISSSLIACVSAKISYPPTTGLYFQRPDVNSAHAPGLQAPGPQGLSAHRYVSDQSHHADNAKMFPLVV